MAKKKSGARYVCVGHFGGHNPTEEECRHPALGHFARKQRRAAMIIAEASTWAHQDLGFELDLTDPLPYEEYSNGETKLPPQIGLHRETAVEIYDAFCKSGNRAGYNMRKRKDLIRVEPIRQARREKQQYRWN